MSRRRVVVGAVVAVGAVGALSALSNRDRDSGDRPAIGWVATDRESFSPVEEPLVVRFRVSIPGEIALSFVDPFGHSVRTLSADVEAGDGRLSWDGRDDEGALVPPEAYAYTLTLTPSSGEPVVWDLRELSGGEYVEPTFSSIDTEAGVLRYGLPLNSRVHVLLLRKSLPFETRVNWEPRLGGAREEVFSVDSGVDGAIVQAMALSRNVVLVEGTATPGLSSEREREPVPVSLEPWSFRPLYHHALHPRERCYDPEVTAVLLSGDDSAVSKRTAVRFDLAEELPPGRVRFERRASLHLYVDGKLRVREPWAFLPYQWVVEPEELGPGTHELTAVWNFRGEHTGIVHEEIHVVGAR